MKHVLQTFSDLERECQAGVFCPECAELCPLSVNTMIHCCQNCAESYCLLCAHELDYCLTCEADLEVSNVMDPMPCSTEIDKASIFPDLSPIQTSDVCPLAVSQPPPQFKQERFRRRCEPDTSHEYADLTTSDNAAITANPILATNTLT